MEMTSDGDVLLHGHAVECDVAPSKTKKRNPKVFVSNKSRSMIHQVLLLLIRSHVIGQVSASMKNRMDTSSPHAGKSHNLSKNVQMGCSYLALCRGHVLMLQVMVPQISLVRQFSDNVSKNFTPCLSAQNRDFL